MSLPNYLASIKSAGFYRFIWDKSTVSVQQAETLRMVLGYSDRGPFNTPVYINSPAEFTTTFGNASKRLERKGIFFHRLALQALSKGPILALNLKPFSTEKISYITFNPSNMDGLTTKESDVKTVYDTNRFWYIDADQLPTKIESDNIITLTSTGDKDSSCSIFVRKYNPGRSYDLSIRQWYAVTGEEVPTYLEPVLDDKLSDYFMEIYAFRGKFTPELCGPGGELSAYFKVTDSEGTVITAENKEEKFPLGYDGTEKIILNDEYTDLFGNETDALYALANDESSNFINKYQGTTLPYFKDANGYYISLDVLFNKDNYDHNLLMKIDESKLDDVTTAEEIRPLLKSEALKGDLTPVYMKGYDYVTLKGKKDAQLVEAIINVIETESGIRTALTNRVDSDYRYLVDTFNSYPTSNAKSKLALLAKEKFNTFAILNFPSIKQFINDPTFEDKGKFSMAKVAELYPLPSEAEGASWAGYFTQVIFSDGTLKSYIPSAALVSNNFMDKYGARQPYYIVAGPTYGVISYSGLTGPDYNYGRSDLDILEPMGINAIIYVPRKGVYINSNQTAKQKPVSALSKIHVRELAIYLQDEIENMMQNYQWELNTQTLRDTIKKKADYILQNVKDNGGIYAFESVCNETNNTPEVIDNEMVILDVEIEPARGAGKMVQTLTIHKTGGLTSTTA